MRQGYDGIQLLESNDKVFMLYVEESMKYIDLFDSSKEFNDVNEVIEAYNVYRLLSHKHIKEEFVKAYATKIKVLMPIVAKFFKSISDDNFLKICDEVDIGYVDEFWLLFDKFKVYEQISEEKFAEYINNPYTTLHYILTEKRIVEHYDDVLADCLRNSDQTAEIIIHNHMEKQGNRDKCYLPNSLKPSEYEGILRNYVHSFRPGLGSLRVIEMFQSTSECPVSDKLRLEARKRQKEMLTDGSVTVLNSYMGVGVSFRDVAELVTVEDTPEGQLFIYDRQWLKQNLDYPTLLNNFIYMFGFVDMEFRSVFPSISSKLGVFERVMGVKGIKEYQTGSSFIFYNMKTSADMHGYIEELGRNNIRFEDIIKWFFEEYLVEEFNVKGFSFATSSKDSSYLEMCRNLASEMDGVLKQYRLYAENGEIDRELLEMSSRPVEFEILPSLRTEKYWYANSDDIRKEMFYLFSDQCLLSYIERIGKKYECLYDLLIKEELHLLDYTRQDELYQINWLIQRNTLCVEDGVLKINLHRAFILKDLYEHEVICPDYYPSYLKELLTGMNLVGDIYFTNTFLSIPESDYLNYVLNKSQYSNGMDLRNRYIHSTYSENEELHKRNYIELMKIMVLIVIKINEEFCNKSENKDA